MAPARSSNRVLVGFLDVGKSVFEMDSTFITSKLKQKFATIRIAIVGNGTIMKKIRSLGKNTKCSSYSTISVIYKDIFNLILLVPNNQPSKDDITNLLAHSFHRFVLFPHNSNLISHSRIVTIRHSQPPPPSSDYK